MDYRLKELLTQMEALGYAPEEALCLCGLGRTPVSSREVERAIAILERQVQFGRKCLEAVNAVPANG